MKISGFSFVRNGEKLHYPVAESIRSALPLVDEFVVAVGPSDNDDNTRGLIEEIGSDKVRILDTTWDLERFPRGMEHAHQTDIAKDQCTGDWLIYLQADEVLHEDDLPTIRSSCERWLSDSRIDGMLFDYLHFWGDFDHVHDSHGWYKREIRIVRNDPEIHSFRSAQSFRRIPQFDGVSYRKKKGTRKLTVIHSGARIFHYGWVRPPTAMQTKRVHFTRNHHGENRARVLRETAHLEFDYGPMASIPRYHGTHPAVMHERIAGFTWEGALYEHSDGASLRPVHRHERWRVRLLTRIENRLLGGRQWFSSRNYRFPRGYREPKWVDPARPGPRA